MADAARQATPEVYGPLTTPDETARNLLVSELRERLLLKGTAGSPLGVSPAPDLRRNRVDSRASLWSSSRMQTLSRYGPVSLLTGEGLQKLR